MIKDYPPYLDYPKPRKPMTKADRIRTMTDEQISRLFMGYSCPPVDGDCPYLEQEVYRDDRDCGKCWLDWLRQEGYQ